MYHVTSLGRLVILYLISNQELIFCCCPACAEAKSRPPSGQAVSSCWFCLSSPHVDTNLIASIGEECYCALDKGQINADHVLLVPIEHYPSIVTLPPAAHQELQQYISALRACFASKGKAFVGFERHLALRQKGGNHCHLNACSVEKGAGERAAEVFQRMAGEAGFEMKSVAAVGGQLDR
jgi:diadenosine tetraphosphate (Ap4A) HIT family hydrolase